MFLFREFTTGLKPVRSATHITTRYVISAHVINSIIYTAKENEVHHTHSWLF